MLIQTGSAVYTVSRIIFINIESRRANIVTGAILIDTVWTAWSFGIVEIEFHSVTDRTAGVGMGRPQAGGMGQTVRERQARYTPITGTTGWIAA